MRIIRTIPDIRQAVLEDRRAGRSIGLVPTMGYLHEGHLSLARAARKASESVYVTIFVNPTQFVAGEDLERYPRDEARDLAMLEREGVDVVFIPESGAIYPEGFSTYIEPPACAEGWCGAARPGHFRGVCTVVSILYNLIQPCRAWFGQKDAQQLAVLRAMTRDLAFPVEVIGMPIVREASGLAMSSRNAYLTPEQREQALALSGALKKIIELYRGGESGAEALLAEGRALIEGAPGVRLDYLGVVDQNTFRSVSTASEGALAIGAVFVGQARLIDNMELNRPA
ncbi:MAG: pantoate--beta-alanine ligase [bacterium]|nr:pantoate--beta-alanine ligase [bacterium]